MRTRKENKIMKDVYKRQLYDRYNTESLTTDELRVLIWRYFISYWNNRRICSANGVLPPRCV